MTNNKHLYQFILSLIYFLCLFYGSNIANKINVNVFGYYIFLTIFFIVSLKIINCVFS